MMNWLYEDVSLYMLHMIVHSQKNTILDGCSIVVLGWDWITGWGEV